MGYDEECSDDEAKNAKKAKKAKNVDDDDANEDWYESLKNL